MLITFEGGEGSGKSTQVQRLAKRLSTVLAPDNLLVTREPGGCPPSEALRALFVTSHAWEWDPLTELFLVFSSRNELWKRSLRPMLEKGGIVVCDRFIDSTYAYQGYGKGVPFDLIEALHDHVLDKRWPDLTFFLDCPTELGLQRSKNREGAGSTQHFEKLSLEFHEKVRQGFLELSKEHSKRFHVVDALENADVIEEKIWGVVEKTVLG